MSDTFSTDEDAPGFRLLWERCTKFDEADPSATLTTAGNRLGSPIDLSPLRSYRFHSTSVEDHRRWFFQEHFDELARWGVAVLFDVVLDEVVAGENLAVGWNEEVGIATRLRGDTAPGLAKVAWMEAASEEARSVVTVQPS